MSVCPECESWKTKTLATRRDTRYNWTWRRKECLNCEHRFATYEVPTTSVVDPEPVNPLGKLEQ